MRRDMDLVRHIMLEVEAAPGRLELGELACDEWPFPLVAYHVEMLAAHGLLDAKVTHFSSGPRGTVKALTWDGHDFLDAIRDERVWRKTKDKIVETVGSVTLGTFKKVAELIALEMVRASIGSAP